jgi:hypothetical protein
MALDLHTLFLFAVFASVVSGLLLLLSWLQNRSVMALAFWAAALLVGSIGIAFLATRGDLSDVWSITVANALIAGAYGIMWGGARIFDNRPASVPLMLAGAIIGDNVGFAIGRTIWWDPLKAFVDGGTPRGQAADAIAANYLRFIEVYEQAEGQS